MKKIIWKEMIDVKAYLNLERNPTEITTLDLSNKNITHLDEDIFENLTQLEGLDLRGNQLSSSLNIPNGYNKSPILSSLPPNLFEHLTQVKGLDLRGNQLTSLPPNLFENLTQLKVLYLWGNKLSSFSSLPPNLFENLTQLKKLDLDENQLTSLPPTLFENLTQLEYLNLERNQLISLPPKIFENLTQLKYLYLSGNQLTSLPPNLFQHNTQLKVLDLERNQLTTLPLVNENCWVRGSKEIERRKKDKEKHWNKWKYVGASLESLPPNPSNYAHLLVFTKTFLGREGGVDWVRGLEEFEELKNGVEGMN